MYVPIRSFASEITIICILCARHRGRLCAAAPGSWAPTALNHTGYQIRIWVKADQHTCTATCTRPFVRSGGYSALSESRSLHSTALRGLQASASLGQAAEIPRKCGCAALGAWVRGPVPNGSATDVRMWRGRRAAAPDLSMDGTGLTFALEIAALTWSCFLVSPPTAAWTLDLF
ncbi:hypothetical protein C2E23DRAFT_311444 [Lenzites betulinus]|nr:hypothetical protein C2E23DRAFT_311444 [Lenzites betulinus]